MGNLITVDDLELDGISLDETVVDTRISEAEARIEQMTGFRFYKHTATIRLDGTGREILSLPQPLITLTSITEDGVAVVSTDYTTYNRRPPGADDRLYPRLIKSSTTGFLWQPDTSAEVQGKWNFGYQNIVIVGDWGFVDHSTADPVVYTTPFEIKRAAVRLVAFLGYTAGSEEDRAKLRISKYGSALTASSINVGFFRQAVGELSGDSELDDILMRYRHPTKGTRSPFAFGGA